MVGGLVVLRHGTVLDGSVAWGRSDVPLSADGRERILSVANRLAPETLNQILSSPQRRALESAEIIGARLSLPVVVESALAAKDYGEHTGRAKAWINSQRTEYEDLSVRWRWRPPGGESYLDMARRLSNFLEAAEIRLTSGALLITHEDGVRVLESLFSGDPGCVRQGLGYGEFRRLPWSSRRIEVFWKRVDELCLGS